MKQIENPHENRADLAVSTLIFSVAPNKITDLASALPCIKRLGAFFVGVLSEEFSKVKIIL